MGRRGSEKKGVRALGEVVLIGCEYSGKTLLCRHLERMCSPEENKRKGGKKVAPAPQQPPLNTATQPSIGIELIELAYRDATMAIREVGGTMQPLWTQKIENAGAVLFVADTASAGGASGAVVEVCDVLRQTPDKCVLLFLNKRDASSALPEETVRLLFGLEELEAASDGRLTVIWGSALTGEGLEAMLNWCVDSLIERAQLEDAVNEAQANAAAKAKLNESEATEANAAAEKAAALDAATGGAPLKKK